jgi:hypothetical protein
MAMTMRNRMAAVAIAAGLAMAGVSVMAQQNTQSNPQNTQMAPASAANSQATGQTFSDAELLPLTVHQAWLKSGKNEEVFFTMVTQLAEMSAQNRGLELPQTKAAGQRVGQMIKTMAKEDTGQLLYAVVDAAVRKVGTPTAATAGGAAQ